ncbi:MAG: hypothetical protein MZW92_04195 [Comamonadaceae bacterium]|nr:hypothetical protein [Comamonadaceae bacterium]
MPLVLDVREPWEFQAASGPAATASRLMHDAHARRAGATDMELDAQPVRSPACATTAPAACPGRLHFLDASTVSTEVANIRGGIDAWSARSRPRPACDPAD